MFGRFTAYYGARKLLWIGGIGIVPVAGLWMYADSFWEYVGIQFLAGCAWAAYELALFLLFFETVPREERTSIMTKFNLANSFALVVGVMAGGMLLDYLGEQPLAYHALFGISCVLRGLSLIALRLTPARSSLLDQEDPPGNEIPLTEPEAKRMTTLSVNGEKLPQAAYSDSAKSWLNGPVNMPEPATVSAPPE